MSRRAAGTAARAKTVIGLEVHCQLTSLASKLFCGCSSDYRDMEPNTAICPVCVGHPGTLPVLNAKAVESAVMIGLALNCTIAGRTLFYRKNYYYPDLPKNFQISQYDKAGGIPIASGGFLQLGEGRRRVRIRRIQLEEDPGKLTYEGTIDRSSHSLVDYNRAGIALVEIVTEPDMESPKEAKAFLDRLRGTIESLGVSNGELEGAMRCDANVSLGGGARVEIKNISSFKEVAKALNYEILRQSTFQEGRAGAMETRHWDERRSITISLRTKEEEQDYRYFPEPDLPPVLLGEERVERVRRGMPELPEVKALRFVREYRVAEQTARELARSHLVSDFFEECARRYPAAPEIANWLVGDLRAAAADLESRGEHLPITPDGFVDFLKLIEKGAITRVQGREVLKRMMAAGPGGSAAAVVEALGLSAVRDEASVAALVEEVLSSMPDVTEQAAKDRKALNFLVGQVLRREPSADPALVARAINSAVGKKKGTQREGRR